jgi:Tfp pilus assembly protein PilP
MAYRNQIYCILIGILIAAFSMQAKCNEITVTVKDIQAQPFLLTLAEYFGNSLLAEPSAKDVRINLKAQFKSADDLYSKIAQELKAEVSRENKNIIIGNPVGAQSSADWKALKQKQNECLRKKSFNTDRSENVDPKWRQCMPLESYEIDSLVVKGLLKQGSTFLAIIESPDSLLWIVHEKDYLGKNFGMVSKISEDEIILYEIVQDKNAEWGERKIVLTIPDPNKIQTAIDDAFRHAYFQTMLNTALGKLEEVSGVTRDHFEAKDLKDFEQYSGKATELFLKCFEKRSENYLPDVVTVFKESFIESKSPISKNSDFGEIQYKKIRERFAFPDAALNCDSKDMTTEDCKKIRGLFESFELSAEAFLKCTPAAMNSIPKKVK